MIGKYVYERKGLKIIGSELIGKYVIVRAKAGIFAGTLKELDGQTVIITDSRRLRYWEGAATLSELSQKGVSKPKECSFPAEIPYEWIPEVIEIISCSEEAKKSIKNVEIWTHH